MKLNIKHIAKLANLPISEEEGKKLDEQLAKTLEYIDILQEVDTKNVQPTAHVTGLENVTREDVSAPSLSQQQALANIKKQYEGFFEVEAILEND